MSCSYNANGSYGCSSNINEKFTETDSVQSESTINVINQHNIAINNFHTALSNYRDAKLNYDSALSAESNGIIGRFNIDTLLTILNTAELEFNTAQSELNIAEINSNSILTTACNSINMIYNDMYGKCESCLPGLTLTNHTCVPVDTTNSTKSRNYKYTSKSKYPSNKCPQTNNFISDSGMCIQCKTGQFNNNKSYCGSCPDGTYFNRYNGTCISIYTNNIDPIRQLPP